MISVVALAEGLIQIILRYDKFVLAFKIIFVYPDFAVLNCKNNTFNSYINNKTFDNI
jgi:hypothetical protein